MSRLIAVVFLLLSVAGCQNTLHKGPAFTEAAPPDSEHALVYLFRIGSTPLYVNAPLHINGELRVDMPNRGYQAIYLKPGSYTIGTRWPALSGQFDVEKSFTFKAGQTHFVALTKPDVESIRVLNDPKNHLLHEFSREHAIEGLRQCMLVVRGKGSTDRSPK